MSTGCTTTVSCFVLCSRRLRFILTLFIGSLPSSFYVWFSYTLPRGLHSPLCVPHLHLDRKLRFIRQNLRVRECRHQEFEITRSVSRPPEHLCIECLEVKISKTKAHSLHPPSIKHEKSKGFTTTTTTSSLV